MAVKIFKLIAGVLPVIYGIWNNYSEKPSVKSLMESQSLIEQRLYRQSGHIRALYILIILLAVWNFVLSAAIYLIHYQ